MSGIYAEFRRVAQERLDKLEGLLTTVEQNGVDDDTHAALRREIHTLKGEANMLALRCACRLAELVEELIHRLGAFELRDVEALGLAFEGLEHLDAVISGMDEGGKEGAVPEGDFEARFGAWRGRPVATPDQQQAPEVLEAPSDLPEEPIERRFEAASSESDVRVSSARLGDLLRLIAGLELSRKEKLGLASDLSRLGTMVAGLRRSIAASAGARTRADIADELAAAVSSCDVLHNELRVTLGALKDAMLEEGTRIDALGAAVRSVSTVRVADSFARYPRLFRRVARDAGKDVVLRIECEPINVERGVMDALSEPLLHLLTNAIDHGVEEAELRATLGKPKTAVVTLAAQLRGARMLISVSDDGAGVAIDAVRRRAIEQRLLREEEHDAISADDTLRILTGAGFTTRTEVTTLSGRGVGLDVVRERVKALGGTLGMRTAAGEGSAFEIDVPTTATLARVLLVEAGAADFALPIEAVEAIVDPADFEVERVGHGRMVRLDGAPLVLRSLPEVLGLAHDDFDDRARIVVVTDGRVRRAFSVDGVRGTETVVVHSSGKLLDRSPMVRSLVTTANGRIAPVLDPATLLAEAVRRPAGHAIARTRSATILIVDDSEIARQVVARHLVHSGFSVIEAMDGRAAMIELSRRIPDVIVTDLEMPVMDGFQLLRAVRSAPTFSHVPIVVLSSLSDEAARAKAGALGADAYIVKETLEETSLRDTLARLIGAEPGAAVAPRGSA